MKKKILAVALAVTLIAIAAGGTLAWFTAEDAVENTFTVGSVRIEIHENGNPTESDTMTFGAMVPIADPEVSADDPGYFEKLVAVKNTGANAAYIRTHIAIPTQLVGYLYLDLTTDGWSRQADSTAVVNGTDYTVFTYDHDAAVEPGAFTAELLQGVYLNWNVDLEENAGGDLVFVTRKDGEITGNSGFVAHTRNEDGTYTTASVNVLVASQAMQVQGFEEVGATEALNTGFGTENPWQP